jgi:hypothetical protein
MPSEELVQPPHNVVFPASNQLFWMPPEVSQANMSGAVVELIEVARASVAGFHFNPVATHQVLPNLRSRRTEKTPEQATLIRPLTL